MNYFVIHNPGEHPERHAFIMSFMKSLQSVNQNGWVAWHPEDTDYTVVGAIFTRSTAEDELKERGAIVWPHLADHDERISDDHHLDKIPEYVGIKTGDTTYAAAKKLAAQVTHLYPRLF